MTLDPTNAPPGYRAVKTDNRQGPACRQCHLRGLAGCGPAKCFPRDRPDGESVHFERAEPGPPFKCPVCGGKLDVQGIVCGGKLDVQGIERTTWTIYDTWCHRCVAHITVRIKAR